jgi:4-deoxy-L-threo-5-hexosulose-uronate ketol-isomerase
MQIRFQNSPKETAEMSTTELRNNFLIEDLMQVDKINLVYSHYDRVIIGGVVPVSTGILLPNEKELKADYFLERREMGIINLGGKGTIIVDGTKFELDNLDALYLGKGTKNVTFSSENAESPSKYYCLSAPAHHTYPTKKISHKQASPLALGEMSTSNVRKIYKYIHNEGVDSCQLVMGLTILEKGSVWNSVPPHTHTRRMEVYFYFDLDANHRLMHFMGQPQETRHLVLANHQAVISPPWSMHFGVGTINYGFIWGMAGENKEFTDMDAVSISSIK